MIFKNVRNTLERIINLTSNKEKTSENISNKSIIATSDSKIEEINHVKKIFNGDYTTVINKFKNDYYYGLNHVSEELRNDKFVVGIALEKNISDLRFVGSSLINQTDAMYGIIKTIAEKNPEKLMVRKTTIEVGAGTTLTLQGVTHQQVEGLQSLLVNNDYKKEFDKLFPNKRPDGHLLEENSDMYVQLNTAIQKTMEQKLSSKLKT